MVVVVVGIVKYIAVVGCWYLLVLLILLFYCWLLILAGIVNSAVNIVGCCYLLVLLILFVLLIMLLMLLLVLLILLLMLVVLLVLYKCYGVLHRLGYARISRGRLTDTEIQMAKFRLPAYDGEPDNNTPTKNAQDVPQWTHFPAT